MVEEVEDVVTVALFAVRNVKTKHNQVAVVIVVQFAPLSVKGTQDNPVVVVQDLHVRALA